MKKVNTEIVVSKHYDEIHSLISKKETYICIDTNILALLFRLNEDARNCLYSLFKSFGNRFIIPCWVISEYSDKATKNQLTNYSSTLKEAKNNLAKNLKNLKTEARIIVNSKHAKKFSYASSDDYFKELDSSIDSLTKLSRCLNNQDVAEINEEISQLYCSQSWRFDIWSLIESQNHSMKNRYLQKMPPGYCDEGKGLNKTGDVILFKEIINIGKENVGCQNVILISQDSKIDWSYKPNRIIDQITNRPNPKIDLRITDPRLQEEFSLLSQKQEFHVITLQHFSKILFQNGQHNLESLLNALSLSVEEEKGEDEEEEIPEEQSQIISQSPSIVSAFKYSQTALEDENFPTADSSVTSKIIKLLKSHNWYEQNSAIESIPSISEAQPDELFVIGRNIYQSAVGGARKAESFIAALGASLASINGRDHILNGIVYEIYFDKNNKLREKLKMGKARNVFALLTSESYRPCRSFINECLVQRGATVLFRPGDPISDEFKIKIEATISKEYQAIEKILIVAIYKNGEKKNLLQEPKVATEFLSSNYDQYLSQILGIDSQQIQTEIESVKSGSSV